MPEMGMGHSRVNSIHCRLTDTAVGDEVISLRETWNKKKQKHGALLTTEFIPPNPCQPSIVRNRPLCRLKGPVHKYIY